MNHETRLRRFEASLAKDKLSKTAVVHYVGVVRRGLEAGDLLAPLREAASQGGIKIARAALLRWATFSRDAALARRVREILNPPRRKARVPQLTADERSRMVPLIEAIESRVRKGVLLLVVWSGLRIGTIFGAEREDLRLWRGTRLLGKTGALRGTDLLLTGHGWKTVETLLSDEGYDAAYGVLRRVLRGVCREAGMRYVPPEEFRRLVLAEAARTGDRNADRGRKA